MRNKITSKKGERTKEKNERKMEIFKAVGMETDTQMNVMEQRAQNKTQAHTVN